VIIVMALGISGVKCGRNYGVAINKNELKNIISFSTFRDTS